ncbi:MAG: hypothetical protein WCL23_05915 [Candidatus Moraniibacteriota bacterium]
MQAARLSEETTSFEVQTCKGAKGNSVSVSPHRGGIVTSIRLVGREILFMNSETFSDPKKNVRGGIPTLFPFSGPVTDGMRERFPGLDCQHGFARNIDKWKFETCADGGLRETLESDTSTKAIYPFDFRLSISTELGEDGSVSIVQAVENIGYETLPVSMGLHPYFSVPSEKRKDLVFDFSGGEIIANDFEKWTNGGTTSIDNPGTLRVSIPGLGTLVMEISSEYRYILVWSEGPMEDYICIEPVMRLDGGLVDDPASIQPGETLVARVTYRLEPEEA